MTGCEIPKDDPPERMIEGSEAAVAARVEHIATLQGQLAKLGAEAAQAEVNIGRLLRAIELERAEAAKDRRRLLDALERMQTDLDRERLLRASMIDLVSREELAQAHAATARAEASADQVCRAVELNQAAASAERHRLLDLLGRAQAELDQAPAVSRHVTETLPLQTKPPPAGMPAADRRHRSWLARVLRRH